MLFVGPHTALLVGLRVIPFIGPLWAGCIFAKKKSTFPLLIIGKVRFFSLNYKTRYLGSHNFRNHSLFLTE